MTCSWSGLIVHDVPSCIRAWDTELLVSAFSHKYKNEKQKKNKTK